MNGNNSIQKEKKGKICLGNKAFYANQDLLQSKLLTKKSKLRMYQTLVRPVVTYACETWVLKENIKSKLRVCERKVLRRIYGPTKESDGTWRIKSNDKLNKLIGNKNIINCIKAQRLAWFAGAAGLITVKNTTSSPLSYTKTLLEVYKQRRPATFSNPNSDICKKHHSSEGNCKICN